MHLQSRSCVFVQVCTVSVCQSVCGGQRVKFRFRTGQVFGRCNSLCGASVRTSEYSNTLLSSLSKPKAISIRVITPYTGNTHTKINCTYNTQCCETPHFCRQPPKSPFLVILLESLWDIFSFSSHVFSWSVMKAAGCRHRLWF